MCSAFFVVICMQKCLGSFFTLSTFFKRREGPPVFDICKRIYVLKSQQVTNLRAYSAKE